MNWEQQRAQILATIKHKRTEMGQIMTKATGEGRTPNDTEEADIAAIEADLDKLEKNLKRIDGIIAAEKAYGQSTATPPTGLTPAAGETPEQAGASADGKADPVKSAEAVQVKPNLDKGIGFAMLVKASSIAAKSGGGTTTREVLQSWGAPDIVLNAAQQKATIGTTTDTNFGAALVDYTNLTGEFIELLRQKTIVDKIAGSMRQVPFNVKIPEQTAGATVGWVGEGKMKPTANPTFKNVTLTHAKIAGIVLLSDELIRFSNPKADGLVRDDLVAQIAGFIDQQFFDPTKAETQDSPASVLNGLTAITSTGVTADAYDKDLNTLIAQLVNAGIDLEGACWAMGETRAMQLSGLRDPLGRTYFEGMALVGSRSLKGLPVLTSNTLADKIVLIVPSQILLADDSVVDFAVSTEATINMGTEQAPNMVNLFQNNLSAIRAERFIRWYKRRVNAAGYIKY